MGYTFFPVRATCQQNDLSGHRQNSHQPNIFFTDLTGWDGPVQAALAPPHLPARSQRGDFAQKHPDFPACSRLTWCTYSLIHLMFLASPLLSTFIHLFGYSATHLVGGVLHEWLSFWQIFLFQQKSHWDFVRVTMAFLITSLNKDLLTLSDQGKKVLNPLRRVLVVPTFFHLLMMEATH